MPLEQDLISITFDTVASAKSKDILVSHFKEVMELASKLNNQKNTVGLNTTNLKEFIKLQGDAEKSTTAYNKTLIASAKVIQEQEKAQQQALKTSKLREQQSERNAKAEERDAAARKKNADVPFTSNLGKDGTIIQPLSSTANSAVNQLDQAQRDATMSAIEWSKAQKQAAASVAQTDNATKKFIVTEKEKQLAQAQDKLIAQQTAAALKNQVREEMSLKGSIEQRRAALIRLGIAYDKLSASERNAPQGQRLQGVVAGLTQQVKTLEAETGRAQRNVGNYGSALAGAGKAAFGFLRTAANIIPGLGISGILLLAYEPIAKFVSAILKGKEAINTFAENYKNLTEVISNSNINAGKQTADLKILYEAATSVTLSMKDRIAAAEALKKEFPDEFANTTALAIVNGQAAAAYDATAASIINVARATAAKSKIDLLEAQRLDIFFQKQKIINATNQELSRATNNNQSGLSIVGGLAPTTGGGISKAENQAIIRVRREKAIREQDLKDQSLEQQEAFLINFVGQKNITKTVIDEVTGRGEKAKAARKVNVKKEVDEAAKLQEMLDKIYAKSRALALENKEPVPESPIIKQAQDEAAAYEKSIERRIRANDEAFAKEGTAQLELFRAGLINKEDYESSLIDIAEKYSKKAIQIQIDEMEAESKFAFKGVDQTQEVADKKAEIEKKIAQLRLQLLQGIQKAEDDDNKKRLEKLEGFIQKAQRVLTEASNLIGSVVDISVTKQKNALRDLEDERQKYYDREITNIQNSTLTEEEKQTRILSLGAKRQAQKEEFDRKNREADLKRAKFEKATNVANIVLTTALAVVRALSAFPGPPLTIPAAIAAGALGAAQLAIAIATPLPRFAKGVKNKSNDGFGIVGEAGAERVHIPGVDPFIVDKETTMFLPKHTNIIPLGSNEINQMMHRVMMEQTASKITKPDYDDRLERAFEKHSNRMIKAMGKRPAASNNRMEAKYQVDLLKTVYGRG